MQMSLEANCLYSLLFNTVLVTFNYKFFPTQDRSFERHALPDLFNLHLVYAILKLKSAYISSIIPFITLILRSIAKCCKMPVML